MSNDASKLTWRGTVSCEGGPVMIVDLPGFAQWTGAAPFEDLRKLDERKRESLQDRMKTLHYYGQFSERLPAPFTLEDGGHAFLQCASEDEAKAKLVALRDAVRDAFKDADIKEDPLELHVVLTESDEEMRAELSPQSEYDASWQSHEGVESWTYSFGRDAVGFFWEIEGGGTAQIAVSADMREIILMRSWLSGDDDTEEQELADIRAFVTKPNANETDGGEIAFPSGKAVVIWSPVAPFQILGLTTESLATFGDDADAPAMNTDMMEGVGTVIRVKPGKYKATLWSTDEEDGETDDESDDESDDKDDNENERPWSCRWCRLTFVEAS